MNSNTRKNVFIFGHFFIKSIYQELGSVKKPKVLLQLVAGGAILPQSAQIITRMFMISIELSKQTENIHNHDRVLVRVHVHVHVHIHVECNKY